MCGRICTKCKIRKDLEFFNKDKRQKYGRRPSCKDCESLEGNRIMKTIRFKIKHLSLYKGMETDLTKEILDFLSNTCLFCNKKITGHIVIHRINSKKGYMKDNIGKGHKICHAQYHSSLRVRDNKGKYMKGVNL